MNGDLTQTQNVVSTDNPQGTGTQPGASDASDFQQAAGMEVLNQTRNLTVANNGDPITSSSSGNTSSSSYIFIIIGVVVFLFICYKLFGWIKSAPQSNEFVPPEPVIVPKAPTVKKSKKQSRSQRHKSK